MRTVHQAEMYSGSLRIEFLVGAGTVRGQFKDGTDYSTKLDWGYRMGEEGFEVLREERTHSPEGSFWDRKVIPVEVGSEYEAQAAMLDHIVGPSDSNPFSFLLDADELRKKLEAELGRVQ